MAPDLATSPDFWLPERLAKLGTFIELERNTYADFLTLAKGWLAHVRRPVLRPGGAPGLDPTGIHAADDFWRDGVAEFTQDTIVPILGRAYAEHFGEDFAFTHRPFVARHLETVENRLVRIPDQVFDEIRGILQAGANEGRGIPEIAAQVRQELLSANSDVWRNRATVIARTETIGGYNAGTNDAFEAVAEVLEIDMEKVWLATDDDRTRHTHRTADGQRVPLNSTFTVGGASLDFPGDPTGPPQEVIQCVPGDTLVQAPGLRAALRRRYQGQMVRIELATGDKLTITPNHPVLRADGRWTPAGEIQEGDQLVRTLAGRGLPGEPNPGHVPTEIRKVYGASRLVKMTDRVALTPKDLHGDAPHGQVEVVPGHRHLNVNREPATDQEVEEFGLTLADLARAGLGRGDGAAPVAGLDPADLAPAGLVGGSGQGAPLLGGELGETEPVGLAPRADLQVQLVQSAEDGGSADPEGTGHAEDALPAFVALAEVVKIERFTFHGHVYNLDTGHGWYSANSIVTRNCRCTMLLVEPGEAVDMSDRQLLAAAGPQFVEPTTLGLALTAAGLPPDWAVVDGWDHSLCVLEFCRAPLHPGPCKGWKHTLKQIAPGVYNALEAARVEKLEAKRKAKIAELKAAGKPIPKKLLKPITTTDPKPPPPLPGTVGVPPMVGTEAPLSPATEAKLAAVSAKVKKEFDPETVKAKKAAKAKAAALAKAEAMSKVAAQKKADDEAKAKAAADKVPPLPKVDSDQPGFVPTPEQEDAMAAAQGGLSPQERIQAYLDLDPDDFDELPKHAQAKILADMAALAHSDETHKLDQGLLKSRYEKFSGKPPDKPAGPPAPGIPAEKAVAKPTVDAAKALAKAENVVAQAGKLGDDVHIMDYDTLTPEEFNALPGHAQAKILADLQDMAGNVDNEGWVKSDAKDLFKMYTGKEMPGGAPPAAAVPEPDQPNVTAVPDTPAVKSATPKAQKAADIAADPKGTPLKDRLKAYDDMSAADVASLSDEQLAAIQADLAAVQTWYTKKNLKVGAKAVKAISDDIAAMAGGSSGGQEGPPTPPPIGSEVAPAAGIGYPADFPADPAAPVYNEYQQDLIDDLDAGTTEFVEIGLTPNEYKGLPPATKLKLSKALAALDTDAAKKLYEQYFGTPHPKAGHAVSATPAPTPEPNTPNLPSGPPKNTFKDWQDAKKVVKGKTYKGANKPIADAVKTGTAQERLVAYAGHIGPLSGQQEWGKLPAELRAAIVADLDNMALSGGEHFAPGQKAKAAALRESLTGKPAGTDYVAPTTGQPKKFTSQAAEKAHNVALNPVLHTTQERLNAYKKLSVVGFKSLPPDTQKAIAADLDAINGSPYATVLESNQALSVHQKLTGAPPGEDFDTEPAKKPAAKKKFASEKAEAAYLEAKEGKPLGYYSTDQEFFAKAAVYQDLTKEDFESLPATVQKQIAKDLDAMGMSKAPPFVKQGAPGIKAKLGISGWNWKPKSAAQKKAEKAAQMTPAEIAELNATYTEAGDNFEKKKKLALSGHAALATPPLSIIPSAQSGPRSFDNVSANGFSGSQMRNALELYGGSSYDPNKLLRQLQGAEVHPDNTTGRQIHAIDAAMSQSALPHPIDVWRGISSGQNIFGSALTDGTDLTGAVYVEHAYASTSTVQSFSHSWGGGGGSDANRLLINIVVPAGVHAVQVSSATEGVHKESEVLLEHGLHYRVLRDHGMVNGRRRLDVEVVVD